MVACGATCSPPSECYAEFIDATFHDKPGLVAELLRHAQNAYWLEKHRHADKTAKQLWYDCEPLHSKPVRLLFAFFGRDGENSVAAFRLLKACIKTLADNKAVEELHYFGKQDIKDGPSSCKDGG